MDEFNEEANEGYFIRNFNELLMITIILILIMTRKIQKHNFSH